MDSTNERRAPVDARRTVSEDASSATVALAHSARLHLGGLPDGAAPITYQSLALALGIAPPNSIHQLVRALEHTMHEDAAAGRPFIAARVISRHRGGIPAPGFFALATALGRHGGDERGASARAFHAAELASSKRCGIEAPR